METIDNIVLKDKAIEDYQEYDKKYIKTDNPYTKIPAICVQNYILDKFNLTKHDVSEYKHRYDKQLEFNF